MDGVAPQELQTITKHLVTKHLGFEEHGARNFEGPGLRSACKEPLEFWFWMVSACFSVLTLSFFGSKQLLSLKHDPAR